MKRNSEMTGVRQRYNRARWLILATALLSLLAIVGSNPHVGYGTGARQPGLHSVNSCLSDANANARVDVVDIETSAQTPACFVYLPLLARSWRQPWWFSTRPDGAVRLTTPPASASDQNPAFSPDGTRIVFTRFDNGYNDGPAGLFLLDLSTGEVTRLTPWEDQDNVNLPGAAWVALSTTPPAPLPLSRIRERGRGVAFRPGGGGEGQGRIVFASDRAEANDLWRIAPDGSDFSRITTHAGLPWYFEPSWSPDGQWIVFEASRPGLSEDGRVSEIWKVRADGSGLTQLTGASGFDDRQPNWSLAGDRILFQRRSLPAGQWDIYTMAPDGIDLRNVTGDPADDTDASWSPDGQFIVYSSDYGELPSPNIFAIAAAGGQPIRVTQSDTTADGAPSWSPNGQWIAFESHTSDETPASLWLIPAPSLNRFVWPTWARTARIAGAEFWPDNSAEDIDAELDTLVAQNVSVVLADSPWGWSYSAWVDDAEFYAVRDVVATMVEKAHARGLKVVMYQTGLELTSEPERNPGLEHPDWPQVSLAGYPILFNDISSDQEHWLDDGEWDLWISPCSTYRDFSLNRVREMARTGIDGLWVDTVYLQHSIGNHEDLWPSADPGSATAFRAATGLSVPTAEDWDDPTWRRWVVWRHRQMTDYLLALKEAAREVNPNLVFCEENWNADTSGATQYANDPADYLAYPDMSTGHEISTIADRVDEGETGMASATLNQWLAFRTMLAFARASDRGKPSWILTYGYQPGDSTRLAGLVLAEGANFYETQGPGMTGTVGEAYRAELFAWIAAHETSLYGGESAAEVGLIYSPRNRDLLDSGSGSPYDVEDSTHFAAYRAAAHLLYRAHVPFDVVLDTDTGVFGRYAVLILPEVWAMSDATAAALRAFSGTLITIGDTGWYDEWLNERAANALAGVAQQHFDTVNTALVAAADTSLLATTAPATVQMGLRQDAEATSLHLTLVNLDMTSPAPASQVRLRVPAGKTATTAEISLFQGGSNALPATIADGVLTLDLPAFQALALVDILLADSDG